jgi:uncharacterized membrane protein YgaE (UPF0421/DUF939 family)
MEVYELLLQLFQILVAAITAYLVKRVDHSQKKRIKHSNKNVKKFVSSILTLFETGRETAMEEEEKKKNLSVLHTTEQSFKNEEENKLTSSSSTQFRVRRVKGAINSLRELKERSSDVDRDDDGGDDSDSSSTSVENGVINPLTMGAA